MKSLEELQKYSAFLGNQTMEDVSFKYIFTIARTSPSEVCFELHHLSDVKLTPEEAWKEGEKHTISHPLTNTQKKLVKVYEQVTVGVFLDPPSKDLITKSL